MPLPQNVVLGPIQFPRSNIADAVPPVTGLSEGEIAINLADKAMYSLFKLDENTPEEVIKIAQNYDAILTAHFIESNPHGTTAADVGLGNVPNVDPRPLYYVNPTTTTLNVSRILTEVEYWGLPAVTYTISNTDYDIGDKIEITRISGLAGMVTVPLSGADWLVDGTRSSVDMVLQGQYAIKIIAHKAAADLWTVMVIQS